ncbi:hypothetical protein DPMN_137208 [Dreissena polymorpha]|uniref:Uncharacterized protein n=1 Tax=Dreissena polymorpha TaxID=45954 RepID=A0A9D4JG88_DREPO|nr:hypothetical protein DPMN_137208 [Dreissena polymorpha]
MQRLKAFVDKDFCKVVTYMVTQRFLEIPDTSAFKLFLCKSETYISLHYECV